MIVRRTLSIFLRRLTDGSAKNENKTTSSEQVDADVGFVKVWNKELTLAEIQAEHATYKTRFGY